MSKFDPEAFGPYFAPLLTRAELNPLGPGIPVQPPPAGLVSFDPVKAFAPHAVQDQEMARACEAGLWLLYDRLERSHEISQSIETIAGSYWHGIMHRREPDFSNAKYWFRRVGAHPIFSDLRREAARLAEEAAEQGSAGFLTTQRSWDALRFIDFCSEVLGSGSSAEDLCRRIQRREWELLFDFCYREATA